MSRTLRWQRVSFACTVAFTLLLVACRSAPPAGGEGGLTPTVEIAPAAAAVPAPQMAAAVAAPPQWLAVPVHIDAKACTLAPKRVEIDFDPQPGRPGEVEWVVKGLAVGEKVRIREKKHTSAYLPAADIGQDSSQKSGKAQGTLGGARAVLWEYTVTIDGKGGQPRCEADPGICIGDPTGCPP